MSSLIVGTTPVQIPVAGIQSVLVQNASSNDVYVDTDPAVSSTTGLHIPAGGSIQLPGPVGRTAYYAVASAASSDVRLLVFGAGSPASASFPS